MRHSLVVLAFALTALVLATAIDRARFPHLSCCGPTYRTYPDVFEFHFDLAIEGDGYFQIEASDGTRKFTRDGRFHTNETWTLVDAAGDVLTPPVSIPYDTTHVAVDSTGQVTLTTASDPTLNVIIGSVYIASFPRPEGLKQIGDETFEATPESGDPIVQEPGTNNSTVLISRLIHRRPAPEIDLTAPLDVDPTLTTR